MSLRALEVSRGEQRMISVIRKLCLDVTEVERCYIVWLGFGATSYLYPFREY